MNAQQEAQIIALIHRTAATAMNRALTVPAAAPRVPTGAVSATILACLPDNGTPVGHLYGRLLSEGYTGTADQLNTLLQVLEQRNIISIESFYITIVDRELHHSAVNLVVESIADVITPTNHAN